MDKSNLPDACFNSTLVQLKAVPVFPSCRWFPSFNSTLVQLKELCANRANLNRKCFNSTLVQLKVGFSPYPYQFADKFQFYLSSIKSRIAYLFRGNLPFVSILP